jgi:UDP-N-acetylglucosamine 2-epimerase (non-hydrolysing)
MRHVAVFTSSRADLGPLGPVIAALDARNDVALTVIATGTHLMAEFGGRLGDIVLSDANRVHCIDAGITGTEPADFGAAFGRIGAGVSDLFAADDIDVLVLLGDRWELLSASGAALLHGVTIAHLHGGETTEGAIDERIRHGITKLADLHLCATDDSARRIRQLGEEARRIIVTGAPGLDRMRTVEPLTDEELSTLVGGPVSRPLGVVVYHPPTVDRDEVAERAREVLDAAAADLGTVLVLYPGADPGTGAVVAEIDAARERHDNLTVARNLGETYLRLLASADVLVGNSSSGIIEAASLRLPVVDVGDRQGGRLRPRNVVHVNGGQYAIQMAIRTAMSRVMIAKLADLTNPYGDGRAAPRIAATLATLELADLARKPLVAADGTEVPLEDLTVPEDATLRDALTAIDRGRQQIALVVGDDGRLIGTVSDGDARRAILAGGDLDGALDPYINRIPIVCDPVANQERVLEMMRRHSVSQVPIVTGDGRLLAITTLREVALAQREPSMPSTRGSSIAPSPVLHGKAR